MASLTPPTARTRIASASLALPAEGASLRRERSAMTAAVFLVSAAGLAFEISLTRLFSLLFQYHYAFLAVSLAVLGLGLGAAAARWVLPRARDRGRDILPAALLGLSLAFPVSAVVFSSLPSAASLPIHAALAVVPFVFIGGVAALVFARFSASSGILYAADLLGGAAGVIAVLALLGWLGAFNLVILLGVIAGLAGVVLAFARREPAGVARGPRRLALGGLALTVGLLAFNLFTGAIDFSPARLDGGPRDKTMMNVLRDPDLGARIVYSAWDPFARVDVVETADPSARYVFTDGGAGSSMLAFDGDLDRVAWLRGTLEYLPFEAAPSGRTLVLGSGAGKDILLALLGGAQSITAVEVNPAMVEATRAFADFNGAILDRPEVALEAGDARTFVERSRGEFDLICLNLVYTQAAEPASQALVENFVFTRQAFRAYLNRLAPGGALAVVSHNALEGSRAATTALQALADSGTPLPEGLGHMALLMAPSDDPTQRMTVLVFGRDPLTEAQINRLAEGASRLGLQPLFIPGAFEVLFAPLKKGQTIEEFDSADTTYDLAPTDDDRPFFFRLDPGLPAPVRNALIVAAIPAVLLLAAAGRRSGSANSVGWGRALYATAIGLGFMLVEVPLIQRFQLLLGYPTLSVVAVLGTLLLSGGAGSLLSQRWSEAGLLRRVAVAAAWIGVLGLVYWLALPAIVRGLLPAPLAVRALATAGLTALLGLPMGIPFPSLLRVAGASGERGVAMLWAVNGVFSVVGSTLAVVISMTWGFGATMLAGAAAYLLVPAIAWRLGNRGRA